MRDFTSARAKIIPPSGIRKFFDLILTMEDVISLGVGEPDFNTPWAAAEAGIYAIERGHTSYTSNKGLLPLRQLVSKDLLNRYGLQYDAEDEIVITTGVSEALDIAIRSVVDFGDEVLVVDPCYVAYSPCVTLAGGTAIPVPCKAANQFKLSPDTLMERVSPKSKVVIMNYPNNPTGAIMTRRDYKGIADIIIDHDLLVINDEVYSELTYSGKHTAVASIDGMYERTITLNGFSKAYSMTGWRVGYLCAPKQLCETALKIHQYVMLCAPIMGQMAAMEALRNGEEDKKRMVNEYKLRRNFFIDGLTKIGLPCHMPEGAFYAFPSVKKTSLNDVEFAERLLSEQHVAVVPGSVFGKSGEGHLRCAYAVARDDLTEAIKRMGKFINNLS